MKLLFLKNIQSAEGAPEEFQVFPYGVVAIEGESDAHLDEESMNIMIPAFEERGNDMVIDYEHQTLSGDQAPAAGWIKRLVNKGKDGLWAVVEWTDKAREYLAKKEYRYFSPVFWVRNGDRKIIRIQNVALTNEPKLNNLRPIVAKLAMLELDEGETKNKEAKMLEKLKKLLGMKDADSEEMVIAKVEALAKAEPKEVVAKGIYEALELKDGDSVSTVVASIHAIKQAGKGSVSRDEFDRLKKELTARDAVEIVAKAISDGKVTPEQKDWAQSYAERDMDGFKLFVAKAPVVMPMTKLPGQKAKADDIVADEATMTIAKLMGNTAEDIKKYGV
jgi:phage I-like protein